MYFPKIRFGFGYSSRSKYHKRLCITDGWLTSMTERSSSGCRGLCVNSWQVLVKYRSCRLIWRQQRYLTTTRYTWDNAWCHWLEATQSPDICPLGHLLPLKTNQSINQSINQHTRRVCSAPPMPLSPPQTPCTSPPALSPAAPGSSSSAPHGAAAAATHNHISNARLLHNINITMQEYYIATLLTVLTNNTLLKLCSPAYKRPELISTMSKWYRLQKSLFLGSDAVKIRCNV